MSRRVFAVVIVAASVLVAAAPVRVPLEWAYPYRPISAADTQLLPRGSYTVPGSARRFDEQQVADLFNPPNWKPGIGAPVVVLHGNKPRVMACGSCHMIDGQGGPGASPLAGLSASYIVDQMSAFKRGLRPTSDTRRPAPKHMAAIATHATAAEIASAARYYSSLRYRPWIRVVETTTVPRTVGTHFGWLEVVSSAGVEPIGNRVIEVAENRLRTQLLDPGSGFVAYVPVGSVARGRRLVENGRPGVDACASCHGPGQSGLETFPPLAGRSPSYLARQLWDFKSGTRRGANATLMRVLSARLTETDIVNITAYLASLKP